MKLKDYVEWLNKLAEKYPDVDVVYAEDDEGNSFRMVNYNPSLGFYHLRSFSSYDPDNKDCDTINAVCLN